MANGNEIPILIDRSTFENADRNTEEVYFKILDYVLYLDDVGLFLPEEIPTKALQLNNVSYYEGQVLNGGHRQFIRNAGNTYDGTVEHALQAFSSMQADAYEQILHELANWVTLNPDEALSKRPEFLEKLDDRFFALHETNPISDFAAPWIISWPELNVIDNNDYPGELEQLARSNPQREQRLIARRIGEMDHWMRNQLFASLATAAAACEPKEVLLNIHYRSADWILINGLKERFWHVLTTGGNRAGVLTDNRIYLFPAFNREDKSQPDNSEKAGAGSKHDGGPVFGSDGVIIGPQLCSVSVSDVTKIRTLSQRMRAAAAIDLLLRKADIPSDNPRISASIEPVDSGQLALMSWLVKTDKEILGVYLFSDRAEIHSANDSVIATAGTEEIKAHYDRAKSHGL